MVKREIKVLDVIEEKPPMINNEQKDEEPTKEEPTKEAPAKEEAPPAKPIKEKKPRAKREKKEPKPEPIPEPTPEPIPEPIQEPIPIEEVKPKKEQKILELVACDKCNRKMTAKTLKYSHEAICPATNPPKGKVTKTKEGRSKPTAPIEIVEAPSMPRLRRQLAMNGMNVRQAKMNHKQEMLSLIHI